MTTLTDGGLATLPEIASRLDPGGATAMIADVLSKKNSILRDMVWMEGNLPTGHQITQTTTALPTATWRQLNTGVDPTKGQTVQYVESCGMLEDESIIDEALLELNGGMAWRTTEDAIKLEGIGQQLATSVFYESVSSNPERIHGLAPRYSATSGVTASSYTLAGTNAGTNARSVWLITWAPRKLYGIYPKGTKAGMERIDNGRQRVLDSNSKAFYAYSTTLKWRCGVAVEDYRYAVRFQWDPDDAAMAADERGLYLGIQDMLSTIYEVTPQTRLYMDRTTLQRLNRQMVVNENRPLEYVAMGGKLFGDGSMQGGERVPTFFGVPIRLEDALVAETAIS